MAVVEKRLNVMEMRCLRSMCEVMYMDWVRNEDVQTRTGFTRFLSGWSKQCMLRWFGHMERMENRMVKWIVGSDVWGWVEDQEWVGWTMWKELLWKMNVCGARKDDYAWWKWMKSSGECMSDDMTLTTHGWGFRASGVTLRSDEVGGVGGTGVT